MNWADVASKGIDFLKEPNALGVLVILVLIGFLFFSVPFGAMVWVGLDGTKRLELSQQRSTDRLESAISKLGEKLDTRNAIANR